MAIDILGWEFRIVLVQYILEYHHPSGFLFLTHEFSMEPRVLDTHIDFPCFHYISRVSVQLELWYSVFYHIPSYSDSHIHHIPRVSDGHSQHLWYQLSPSNRHSNRERQWFQARPTKCHRAQSLGAAFMDLLYLFTDLPSGNLLHSYWKWPFIVDLPIENVDFP